MQDLTRSRENRHMPQPSKVVNPFYVLLVLAGCAFAITASAYGVMTVRQLNRSRTDVSPADDRFTELMDEQGPKIMFLELLLLGIGTVGAITVDQYFAADESGSQGISGSRHDAVRTTKFTDTAASIQQHQEQAG